MCEREQFSVFYNHLVWMSIFLILLAFLYYCIIVGLIFSLCLLNPLMESFVLMFIPCLFLFELVFQLES
jgi:hypothetical protein